MAMSSRGGASTRRTSRIRSVFKARVAYGLCLRSAVPAPRPPVLLTIGFWWAGRASQGISSVSRYRGSSRFISVHRTWLHLRASQGVSAHPSRRVPWLPRGAVTSAGRRRGRPRPRVVGACDDQGPKFTQLDTMRARQGHTTQRCVCCTWMASHCL